MSDIGAIVTLTIFAAFAIAGAWWDARLRIIPNWLNGAFLFAGLALVGVFSGWEMLLWSAAHFLAALVFAIVLFALKLWGGGDAKFYAAMAAWFPLRDFVPLFAGIALAGLFVVIGFLIARRAIKTESHAKQLPYGIAIALGGLVMQLSNHADLFV